MAFSVRPCDREGMQAPDTLERPGLTRSQLAGPHRAPRLSSVPAGRRVFHVKPRSGATESRVHASERHRPDLAQMRASVRTPDQMPFPHLDRASRAITAPVDPGRHTSPSGVAVPASSQDRRPYRTLEPQVTAAVVSRETHACIRGHSRERPGRNVMVHVPRPRRRHYATPCLKTFGGSVRTSCGAGKFSPEPTASSTQAVEHPRTGAAGKVAAQRGQRVGRSRTPCAASAWSTV